jgi:integrase/recombinase XerD
LIRITHIKYQEVLFIHTYILKMKTDMDMHSLSNATQEGYLRRVDTFLHDIKKDVNNISMDDIREYIIYLKDTKNLCFGTINAYISAIKFFYTITLEKDWDKRKVPRMRGYKPLPAVMSKEEIFEILNIIDNLKHRTIITLMYGSGLRVSEVVRLKTSDIDSRNHQIIIRQSKNKSDRYAILPEYTLQLLREYWMKCGKPKDWLFPGTNPSVHYNVKSVKNLVIRLREKLNIQKRISAHTFRHCFATHLLEDNVQLANIQHLMGHKSIITTTRYLHMTSKTKMGIRSPIESYGRGNSGCLE